MKNWITIGILITCASSHALTIELDKVKLQYLSVEELSDTVLEAGELCWVTDDNSIRIGDGITTGGWSVVSTGLPDNVVRSVEGTGHGTLILGNTNYAGGIFILQDNSGIRKAETRLSGGAAGDTYTLVNGDGYTISGGKSNYSMKPYGKWVAYDSLTNELASIQIGTSYTNRGAGIFAEAVGDSVAGKFFWHNNSAGFDTWHVPYDNRITAYNDITQTLGPAAQMGMGRIKFPVSSATPSDPVQGDAYLDSDDNKLHVYDGTTWQACW